MKEKPLCYNCIKDMNKGFGRKKVKFKMGKCANCPTQCIVFFV